MFCFEAVIPSKWDYHWFFPITLFPGETLEFPLAVSVHEGLRQLIWDVFGPEANILRRESDRTHYYSWIVRKPTQLLITLFCCCCQITRDKQNEGDLPWSCIFSSIYILLIQMQNAN